MTENMNMTKEALAEKLYQTMQAEYDTYLATVLQMEPKDIIQEAYRITIKADILILFEDDGLTDTLSTKQLAAACQLKNPLETLYQTWLDSDTNYMDLLKESVQTGLESYAKSLSARHLPKPCQKTEKTKPHPTQQER